MSAGGGKAQPVAYLISSPSEPDIGSWLSEKPATVDWLTSQPLYPHPDPVRAALVEALEDAADALEWTGAKHASARARDALKAAGEGGAASPDLSPGAKAVIERLTALNDERAHEIDRLTRELSEAKARALPDGWVAVPVEPTPEMIDRVLREGAYHDEPKARAVLRAEYMDMLSARPEYSPNGYKDAMDKLDAFIDARAW